MRPDIPPIGSFLAFWGWTLFIRLTAASEDPTILLNEVARANNQSLLWGPYRSQLYLGIRPRLPQSLATGLFWVQTEDPQKVQHNFRYTCEQNEAIHGWDEYDQRRGGRQSLHDAGNYLDLQTDFVKVGGNWGLRIKGTPRKDAPKDLKSTVVFSVSLEGQGSLEITNKEDPLGFEGAVTFEGNSPELGSFTLEITKGPDSNAHPVHGHPSYSSKPLKRTFAQSYQVPELALWQTKPILFTSIKQVVDGYAKEYGDNSPPPWQVFTIGHKPGQGNVHLVQKVFQGSFEFDVLFSSGSASAQMTSTKLGEEIDSTSASFRQRFKQIFNPEAPFTGAKYERFSQSLFSNLLGGIGYFHGDSIVDRSYASEYEELNEGFWEETAEARGRGLQKPEGPSQLFTSVPSRPFFPRGFLWDEGFHLLPVLDWDPDLALEITKSWFDLIDDDGWIAREQILGPEARSKVPEEFQVQYPHYANPPTLFFILQGFVDRLQARNGTEPAPRESLGQQDISGLYTAHLDHPEVALQYLQQIYPLLKRHYFWFRKTQWGDIKSYDREAYSTKEAYRWRGRTPRHLLTSGLDDYPRAQPPHPGELHVDLISWMGMMTRSMKHIAEALRETDDVGEFARYEGAIIRNIDDLHWSEQHQTYCDATIDDYEESVHVCHKGYVSLFPFLVGLLPGDSPRLGPILNLIQDPEELWTEYGIRSLSKKDPHYGTDENYWRSPIWINMNYLILERLLELAKSPSSPYSSQARGMYTSLRINIVENVYKEYQKNGFVSEQYNPETGAGQRTQYFTGWTSLVVKIMKMPDLSSSIVNEKGKDEGKEKTGVKDEL